MLVTEKEARTKWCPMFRVVNGADQLLPTNNRTGMCIASGCMLWNWQDKMFDGPDSYISEPGPKGWCGLLPGPPI